MEYLIKKSDQTIVETFTHTPDRLQLPEQTGGDVTFVKGAKRPVDLGDYVLVIGVEIPPALLDETTKRDKTVITVENNVVTITQPAIAKDADDLLADVYRARQANIADGGYGTHSEQFEILGEQGIGAYQQHIASVKARHPTKD